MTESLLTGNKSNFVHIEGASQSLNECQNYLSTPYTHKENCFDKISIYYQDTIYYVDPVSRPTYSFATKTACESSPANSIALHPDGNDYNRSTPTPVKTPPAHFQPSEIRSTIQSITFSAQKAGLCSPKLTKDFRNRILLTKQSD